MSWFQNLFKTAGAHGFEGVVSGAVTAWVGRLLGVSGDGKEGSVVGELTLLEKKAEKMMRKWTRDTMAHVLVEQRPNGLRGERILEVFNILDQEPRPFENVEFRGEGAQTVLANHLFNRHVGPLLISAIHVRFKRDGGGAHGAAAPAAGGGGRRGGHAPAHGAAGGQGAVAAPAPAATQADAFEFASDLFKATNLKKITEAIRKDIKAINSLEIPEIVGFLDAASKNELKEFWNDTKRSFKIGLAWTIERDAWLFEQVKDWEVVPDPFIAHDAQKAFVWCKIKDFFRWLANAGPRMSLVIAIALGLFGIANFFDLGDKLFRFVEPEKIFFFVVTVAIVTYFAYRAKGAFSFSWPWARTNNQQRTSPPPSVGGIVRRSP